MHNCARFFVEIASELYFSRLKMVKRKEISVEKRAQIIILQKTGKSYREIAIDRNLHQKFVLKSMKTWIHQYRSRQSKAGLRGEIGLDYSKNRIFFYVINC